MRRCVSLFHILRAVMRILTCYAGHHNVLRFHYWQGLFSITLQRYDIFLDFASVLSNVFARITKNF